VEENFDEQINFEKEKRFIDAIPASEYAIHFNNAMNLFYIDSSQAERNHFLDLATRLIVADKEISQRENLFLNELYYAWEEETEE
jgi:hypothetical protein